MYKFYTDAEIEKIKNETNVLKYMWYEAVFYWKYFTKTWIGRAFVLMVIFAILMINIARHEIHPAPRLDAAQKVQMEKLHKKLAKLNLAIPENEMTDNWKHWITIWQSKKYPKLCNERFETLDEIRVLKNEAFVKNGFDSWQNRFMNALPRIWILNAHLKKLAFNEHIKHEIRIKRKKQDV